MEITEITQGQTVHVPATVTTVQGRAEMPPETHSVVVRLNDGQAVHTNIGNLVLPEAVAATEKDAAAALSDQAGDHSQAMAELANQLTAEQEAHAATATERDEWKQKAEDAEAAARSSALELESEKSRTKSLTDQLAEATKEEATPETPADKPKRTAKGKE